MTFLEFLLLGLKFYHLHLFSASFLISGSDCNRGLGHTELLFSILVDPQDPFPRGSSACSQQLPCTLGSTGWYSHL